MYTVNDVPFKGGSIDSPPLSPPKNLNNLNDVRSWFDSFVLNDIGNVFAYFTMILRTVLRESPFPPYIENNTQSKEEEEEE